MGLLEQLWDDTVAGPRPDSGLSKLRKYPSFSPSSTSGADPVTRSINILRSKSSNLRHLTIDPGSGSGSGSGSVPSSPSSDSPLTPGTARGDWRSLRRKPPPETAEPRSPTVYDWVVISSMDR